MKFTMRDKICKLIGKYENMEQDFRADAFVGFAASSIGIKVSGTAPDPARKAFMCNQFVNDLKSLLEEDEAPAAPADPRKTAPAGKWCADSAACAAESAAKEARSNG